MISIISSQGGLCNGGEETVVFATRRICISQSSQMEIWPFAVIIDCPSPIQFSIQTFPICTGIKNYAEKPMRLQEVAPVACMEVFQKLPSPVDFFFRCSLERSCFLQAETIVVSFACRSIR